MSTHIRSVRDDDYPAAHGIYPRDANGHPIRNERAESLKSKLVNAGRVEPRLGGDYVVKGWLDRAAMSVVYGDTNVGKSFFGIDLGHHVARGARWAGCRVRPGNVLYIASEGGTGFLNRACALKGEATALWILPTSVDLCGPDVARAIIEVVRKIDDASLIVFDTLARSMGAGDENNAPDMGRYVGNVDRIRAATDAHCMVIHHTGKDASKGARGHSSLRAATDTEIELTKDGDVITAETRKQRDMQGGRVFAYKLKCVAPAQRGLPKTNYGAEVSTESGNNRRSPRRHSWTLNSSSAP